MYVDSGSGNKSSSHYMVATDEGVFEIDNGILLGLWNADELYGKLKDGHTYTFITKGRRVTNIFFQEYPYIVKIKEKQ